MSEIFALNLGWVIAAAALGFIIPLVFAGMLRLTRSIFVVVYLALTAPFLYAFVQWSYLSVLELFQQNWVWGLVGAVLVGAFTVRNILSQPASPHSRGLALAFDICWSGIIYGALDALFLSVLPVLATWQAFSALDWAQTLAGKILVGCIALVASLFVTVAYHLGYPECRSAKGMKGPAIGNGVMSLGYILTNNPITAVFSHIGMHIAGVLHGPATVIQLPPHYPARSSSPAIPAAGDQNPPAFMVPFMKMPLIFYRLGLGRMLGKRFMLLTHIGRRSRKVYRSVLAVLRFDEKTGEILAVSPWSGSNWYRNIQATPALEVETGSVRYVPVQRSLAPEEIAAVIIEYRRSHPVFSRMIARIPGWNIDASYDEFLQLAQTLRGVAFQPK